MPELSGDSVFRSESASAQRCDFLRRRVAHTRTTNQGPHPPRTLCSNQKSRKPKSVTDPRVVWQSLVRTDTPSKPRLTDTVHGIYLAIVDLRRASHADWTPQAGYHIYETNPTPTSQGRRQTRQVPKGPLGPRPQDRSNIFSTTNSSRLERRPARPLAQDRALPHHAGPQALRSRLFSSGWVVEHPDRPHRRRADSREVLDRKTEQTLPSRESPRDTQRNLEGRRRLLGANLQAHPRPVWLLTYDYGAKVLPGHHQRLHPAPRPASTPLSWVKIMLAVLVVPS